MRQLEREAVEAATTMLSDALNDPDNDLFAAAEQAVQVLRDTLATPDTSFLTEAGRQEERTRVLDVLRGLPRAGDDGRDLVVRTDALRKVQHA